MSVYPYIIWLLVSQAASLELKELDALEVDAGFDGENEVSQRRKCMQIWYLI